MSGGVPFEVSEDLARFFPFVGILTNSELLGGRAEAEVEETHDDPYSSPVGFTATGLSTLVDYAAFGIPAHTKPLLSLVPRGQQRTENMRDTNQRPRRNFVLAALLLLDTVPLAQPFSTVGFNSNSNSNNLRLLSTPDAPQAHRTQQRPSPLFSAAGGDRSDHGDVITGSNQLEGWKTNTASGAVGAPAERRSNVMGGRVHDGPEAEDSGSGGRTAGPEPPAPPSSSSLLERGGGGVLRGDAEEGAGGEEVTAWRAEAATTSAELQVSLKVCENKDGSRLV